MTDRTDPASSREDGFRDFYLARGARLRSTAYLLCGDWHLAEDLVQSTFTKLYLVWPRIHPMEHLDQYARRTLVRTFLSERRRAWRREHPVQRVPDAPGPVGDAGSGAEERVILLAALAALPSRQRATLVLRFWEDMSVEQTADLLGVSAGSVKTHTSRGLAALRSRLGSMVSLVPEEVR